MQTPQRHRHPGLIGRLFAEPWRFGFLPGVALLLGWLRRSGIDADKALEEVLRFENSLSLAFPASEIEAVRAEDNTIAVTPTCIGLLGNAGTLPLHDTDRCAAGDPAGAAFVDVVSRRIVALFWQAWAMHRPEVQLDTRGADTWRPLLAALRGGDDAGEMGAWFSGLLRMRPVSASALESILAGELRLPVRVEPLTGCWEILPPNRRSKLGSPNARLGHGATLGRRQWNLDRRLRIVIGPLGLADFEHLLPRSEGYRALEQLLACAVGQGRYEYEVCLLPGPECIRPLKLTTKPGEARRLGWDSFIADGPNRSTRREVSYLLHPLLHPHTKGERR